MPDENGTALLGFTASQRFRRSSTVRREAFVLAECLRIEGQLRVPRQPEALGVEPFTDVFRAAARQQERNQQEGEQVLLFHGSTSGGNRIRQE